MLENNEGLTNEGLIRVLRLELNKTLTDSNQTLREFNSLTEKHIALLKEFIELSEAHVKLLATVK